MYKQIFQYVAQPRGTLERGSAKLEELTELVLTSTTQAPV